MKKKLPAFEKNCQWRRKPNICRKFLAKKKIQPLKKILSEEENLPFNQSLTIASIIT
jgi:hypothetical protein